MAKRLKRAFTIVELVIVIAVIAILAAVLIPTFTTLIDKANESNDIALVKNLNTALVSKEATDEVNTMQKALDAAYEYGYTVDKLTPSSSGDIVWDEVNNRFALINEKKEVVFEDGAKPLTSDKAKIWKIVTELKGTQDCSWYVGGLSKEAIEKFTFTMGVDTGSVEADVNYVTAAEQDVTIRTKGGTLTVDAENATVSHHGTAVKVVVKAVAINSSYHEYGQVVGNVSIKKGHLVAENGSTMAAVIVAADNATDIKLTFKSGSKVNGLASSNANVTAEDLNGYVQGSELKVDIMQGVYDTTLFAGGLGTEASPYLIETGDQFKNIADFSDEMATAPYYFSLIDDIEVMGEGSEDYITDNFYGKFDGNNYSITIKGNFIKYCWFIANPVVSAEISNVTIFNEIGVVIPLCYGDHDPYRYQIKFTNVNMGDESTDSVLRFAAANAGSYLWFSPYETVFVNCDNYYDYNGDSGIYAGIYVGGYPIFKDVAKVSFTDCDNYGDVVATYAGLFYGNMQNTGLSVTIENCANNGNILGTKTAGALNNTMTNYDEYFAEQIKNLSGTDNIRVITDDTLAITEENGVLVIHQASNQNADKYSITFSAWPGIFDENGEQVGTSRTIIEIEIDNIAFESGKYVSDYVVYTMYDLNSYQALGKDVSNLQWVDYKENLRYAIVDGYLVVDYSNSLVTGDIVMNGIVAKVSVSVYGDESLLATADKA